MSIKKGGLLYELRAFWHIPEGTERIKKPDKRAIGKRYLYTEADLPY